MNIFSKIQLDSSIPGIPITQTGLDPVSQTFAIFYSADLSRQDPSRIS